jgi:hypothetical protein
MRRDLARSVVYWKLVKYKDYNLRNRNMEIGEAVVSSACQGPKGAQQVELRRFARWRTANG